MAVKIGMKTLFWILGTAILVQLAGRTNAADFSVKVTEKEPPKEVGEAIRKMLQPKAVQVLNGNTPLFEFWLSSEVPLKSKPAAADKALEAIPETTVLGVVTVGNGQRDYKDNEVAAGVYTMRFGLQPQDGDHLGTADFAYFALLIQAKNDVRPDGFATAKAMVKASSHGTASEHPVVLSLRPAPSDTGELPKLNEPVADHKSVRVKVPAKAAADKTDLLFELVFKGHGHIQ
jgi:hypothetical protein